MKKMEKKVISITLLMVMLVAMLIPSISSAATGEVTINDRNLKEAIAQEVDTNKDGIITEEEMRELGHIDIPEGVTDLTGLEYATGLGSINMIYTETTPNLVGETKSQCNVRVNMTISASVSENSLIKLDFLKKIHNLRELFIEGKDTTCWREVDYSSLKDIKTLKVLSARVEVAPQNMRQLKEITSIESLNFTTSDDRKSVVDMEGVEGLTKLEILNIDGYKLLDANKIGELKNLEYISLNNVSGVSDLSALANCNQLLCVGICSTDLSDLSFLKNKQQLEYLSIIDSPIKYMDDRKTLLQLIPTLPNLQSLYIDVDGMKLESLEAYKEWEDFFTYKGDEEEGQNSNDNNTAKTPTDSKTEAKTETKSQAEKPTVIPQAGINVVRNVILILVAMSVVILAIAFVKAKRK